MAAIIVFASIALLQDAQGPKTYMDAILSVHRTYNNLVMTAFESEQGFKKAMEKVCAR
jgi:hypothetical protein